MAGCLTLNIIVRDPLSDSKENSTDTEAVSLIFRLMNLSLLFILRSFSLSIPVICRMQMGGRNTRKAGSDRVEIGEASERKRRRLLRRCLSVNPLSTPHAAMQCCVSSKCGEWLWSSSEGVSEAEAERQQKQAGSIEIGGGGGKGGEE